MGAFFPVFLAFILNSLGYNIFRQPKDGCDPLVSSLIFLFALFLLLLNLKLNPTPLRKIWKSGSTLLQFLVSMFIMEVLMADFWTPLEAFITGSLVKIADLETDLLAQSDWESEGIFQFLRCELAGVIASYLLSIFFLIAVLHATRYLDLRLLRCGFYVFLMDIVYRTRRWKRITARRLGVTKRRGGYCNVNELEDDAMQYLAENEPDQDDAICTD